MRAPLRRSKTASTRTACTIPARWCGRPKFDDRSLFRYTPDYRGEDIKTHLDWSDYSGSGGGFQGAVEMCNNNGACRKMAGGAMCPSYRVTRDERDVTRGRANTLRLAITGQLGPDALASDDMVETLKYCVSCKACRRECPTGVDMARMKIEVQAARAAKHGLTLHDRLVGWLPHYAPLASRWPHLFNMRDSSPLLRRVSETFAQFSAKRSLPAWRSDIYRDRSDWNYNAATAKDPKRDVVLFADTFNRYFERENIDDTLNVLVAGGYRVHAVLPKDADARPLCCGRTFLSVGQVDQARIEMERTLEALTPYVARGIPVVGLEPSCLLTFRDEMPGAAQIRRGARAVVAGAAAGGISCPRAKRRPAGAAARAFAAKSAVPWPLPSEGLRRHARGRKRAEADPELSVSTVESSCCGMAGSFGYDADTIDVSLKMGELSLLPAVRKAPEDALIVADGTSCRHQIHDGSGRGAIHVARVLAMSVAAGRS